MPSDSRCSFAAAFNMLPLHTFLIPEQFEAEWDPYKRVENDASHTAEAHTSSTCVCVHVLDPHASYCCFNC